MYGCDLDVLNSARFDEEWPDSVPLPSAAETYRQLFERWQAAPQLHQFGSRDAKIRIAPPAGTQWQRSTRRPTGVVVNAAVVNADFHADCPWEDINFTRTTFYRVIFENAHRLSATQCAFIDCTFLFPTAGNPDGHHSHIAVSELANCKFVGDLSKMDFTGCVLHGVNFLGCTLTPHTIRECPMAGVNLSGVHGIPTQRTRIQQVFEYDERGFYAVKAVGTQVMNIPDYLPAPAPLVWWEEPGGVESNPSCVYAHGLHAGTAAFANEYEAYFGYWYVFIPWDSQTIMPWSIDAFVRTDRLQFVREISTEELRLLLQTKGK